MVEIVADEIGPSLRWATAQVERNDRRSGEGGPAPGGGSAAVAAAARPAATTRRDEEPF